MKRNIHGVIYIVLLLLGTNLFFLAPCSSGEGFDLVLTDPENDVEDMEKGKVQGYEHIDLVELKSSENLLKTQVIIELSVKGVITDSQSISYSVEIFDGDTSVYGIFYSDGVGMGTNYEDDSSDVLQTSGDGTSTLQVNVQKSDMGDISDFDMSGNSFDFSDDFEQFCMDWIPDMDIFDDPPYYDLPVMIKEPKPNATAYGTKIIDGICEPWSSIESVEIQIDSKDDDQWNLASTSDNWETWEYSWDTTKLSDGKHKIFARGFNGSEYFYDSISVHIDQSCELNPKTTDVPELKVGLELHYSVDLGYVFGGVSPEEDFEITTSMVMKVIKKEKITMEGKEYEVYNIQISTEMSMSMDFEGDVITTSSIGQGTQWIRTEDLATVKSFMKTTGSYGGFEETSEVESTYEPPMDSYDFPVSVADAWRCSLTENVAEIIDYEGEKERYSESYDLVVDCEVLNYGKVHVPAGSYDTFAIWSEEATGGYYGGGTTFFSPMDGYSVNYYSPELGFPVKTEQYLSNRELFLTIELTSVSEAKDLPGIDSEPRGGEVPFYYLLLPIIVVLIIATAIAVRRRKKGSDDLLQEYNLSIDSQNQIEPSTTYGSSLSSQNPPAPGVQAERSSPSYPPPPPVQSTKTQVPGQSQTAEPVMHISCPKCHRTFSIQSTTGFVHCPYCGVKGKL